MKCGLIGKTLKHSYSPQIHKLLKDYEYELYPLLEDEVKELFNKGTLDAFNVTIPYKKTAFNLCKIKSERALHIGAVNTVVKLSDGTYFGDNTDYDGFKYLTDHASCDFSKREVVILGTGGATVMAANVAKDMGAAKICIVSRNIQNAENVCDLIRNSQGEGAFESSKAVGSSSVSELKALDYEMLEGGCNADILINATPQGMYPDCGKPMVDLDDFTNLKFVFDLIANPFRTKLVLEAKERGIVAEGGLRMLVAQAVEAAEIFVRKESYRINGDDSKRIEEIYEIIKNEQCNVVLIGMPGCGKSTYGKMLSSKLSRKLADTDSQVEEEAQMSIPEIFEKYSEAEFRKREADVISRVTKESNLVIATGGGAVLNKENRENLMMNAKVIWIDAPIDVLATEGRPLSKDRAALIRLYDERMPIYKEMADEIIYRQ